MVDQRCFSSVSGATFSELPGLPDADRAKAAFPTMPHQISRPSTDFAQRLRCTMPRDSKRAGPTSMQSVAVV